MEEKPNSKENQPIEISFLQSELRNSMSNLSTIELYRRLFLFFVTVWIFGCLVANLGCDAGRKELNRQNARKELLDIGYQLIPLIEKNEKEPTLTLVSQISIHNQRKFVSSNEASKSTNEIIVLFDNLNLNDGISNKPLIVRIFEKSGENRLHIMILDSTVRIRNMILTNDELDELLSINRPLAAKNWILEH